jgi:putative intracellular protease/amidase
VKVLVVCAQRYNGHELWTALGVMQEAGLEFDVASTMYMIEDEVTGQSNTIKLTLDDIEPEEIDHYDGLMFVSGNMADTEKYWHLERTLAYVQVAKRADMALAAICCSVPTIRHAASGKVVSFFPLVRSRQLLKDAGAILSTVSISVDEKLVTAEHQMSSQMWATYFSNVVKGETPGIALVDSGFVPGKGSPRKPIPEVEYVKRRWADGNDARSDAG